MFGVTTSLGRLLLLAIAVALIVLGRLVYNRFFHPLRSYPGPWLASVSLLWYLYHAAKGDHHEALQQAHLKYGPVVRVAPDELSFVEAQAWKDIYSQTKPEFAKEPSTVFSDDPAHPSILSAPGEQHAKLRRILSHAFSDKALYGQEAVINSYVMSLVDRLRSQGSGSLDIVQWFNFVTFDIVGHLAFAESFDCLSESAYHPWVKMIFGTIKFWAWTRAIGRVAPGLVPLFMRFLMPKSVTREYKANMEYTAQKLERRRQKKLDYTDFAEHLLRAERDGVLDTKDVLSNLPLLVVAGSETAATALAGTVYYMLTNPRVYERLVDEVRSRFRDHSEITLVRLSELKYLPAVLDETMRIYPPAPTSHPRVVPPDGGVVCGRFIPGRTVVGIPNWACFRSPYNFARPEEYIPERFLGESDEFAGDKREALQPFMTGPRNCIGRNLANIEMRLILAHLILEFDFELSPESKGWEKQDVYIGLIKPELMVKLHSVRKTQSS